MRVRVRVGVRVGFGEVGLGAGVIFRVRVRVRVRVSVRVGVGLGEVPARDHPLDVGDVRRVARVDVEGSALDDRGVVEEEDRAEVGGRRNEALALVGGYS